MNSWKEMLKASIPEGEKIIFCTLSDEEMGEKFDTGYGGQEGKPFTAWSENWVFFPAMYDGSEWMECVPRNPCDISIEHIGG